MRYVTISTDPTVIFSSRSSPPRRILSMTRYIEPHHAGSRSMTLGQKEELRAGEKRVLRRDARLMRGENDRPVIKLDGDARDPPRVDSPGLLAHESERCSSRSFQYVPTGRPHWQRELQRRLVDVPDVGGHVKELAWDVGDLDDVLDREPSILRHRSRRDEHVQTAGETPDEGARPAGGVCVKRTVRMSVLFSVAYLRTIDGRQSSVPASCR
jgi:hypothetical protein